MLDVALLVVVVGGGAAAIRYLATRANDPALDEAWRAAARRVGGEVELVPARFLRDGRRQIRLSLDDVSMLVRTEVVGTSRSKNIYTRLSAGPLPAATGTRIKCEKRGLVSKLSLKIMADPVLTGHAEFDADIHTTGMPESLLFTFLDRPMRSEVLTSQTGFDLDDGLLTISCEGEPADAEPLVKLIRFGEKIVKRWCELVQGPRRLAQHLKLEARPLTDLGHGPELVAEGQFRGRTLTLLVRVDEAFVLTVLRLADPSGGEWTMERSDDDAFSTTGGPPEAVRTFASTAPRALLGLRATGGAIELVFDGLTPDHADVVRALEGLLAVASTAQPYR